MQLCLALDLPDKQACLHLLEQLKGLNLWVKLGLRGFVREGPAFVQEIQKMGFKIFLDLKLHDISYTMQEAALECAKLGVEMITLHASAGGRALESVVEPMRALSNAPLLMGVTILTSLDSLEVEQVYHAPLTEQALHLAKLCFSSGLDGVVCSVLESLAIKQATKADFLTLTPGIRPNVQEVQDQKRVGTIQDALRARADFIVVGRPIYNHPKPLESLKQILTQMEGLHASVH
ncbi:orotidine-5'-phosphate decarboxylase [Helicobacter baculiformis]|uniref:Orotidine 5'-phosphate decarboxylase n=1 Tax=Helicobacter baculiformis TaxID=427351 RepID=A0ABV7ZKI4_9HELI|nr:orotidine-5'-phosphate decarboxylase [Helicobacter baculiformis]